MYNISQYIKAIETTVVPSRLSDIEKSKLFEPVNNIILNNLPIKLYRFRSCNESHLSALYNDELWFSNGSEVNDDFDARLFYNKNEVVAGIKKQVSENGQLIVIELLKSLSFVPLEISSVIPNANESLKRIKSLSDDQITVLSTQILSYVLNGVEERMSMIPGVIQQSTQFACFSERVNSDVMWGLYSENATGFAVEYTFDNTNYICSTPNCYLSLYPIVYSNKRLDATKYAENLFQQMILLDAFRSQGLTISPEFIQAHLNSIDSFMPTKIALYKSKDWKQEKEWRLFYIPRNAMLSQVKHNKVIFRPTAIYLGRKISAFNQKIITDMAIEKKLPVYKMSLNEESNTYSLKRKRIL